MTCNKIREGVPFKYLDWKNAKIAAKRKPNCWAFFHELGVTIHIDDIESLSSDTDQTEGQEEASNCEVDEPMQTR